MISHEVEALAEAIVRRMGRTAFEHIRGEAIDAIQDAAARAIPGVLEASSVRLLLDAINRNTARLAYLAGWRKAFGMLAGCGEEAVPGFDSHYAPQRELALGSYLSGLLPLAPPPIPTVSPEPHGEAHGEQTLGRPLA
jgi:hypothetical protein